MNTFTLFVSKHRIVISVLIILLLGYGIFHNAIGQGAIFVKEVALSEWSALTLPSELREATFFKTSKEGTFAYTAQNFFYARDTRIPAEAFSVTHGGNSVASIEKENGIYSVRVDGTVIASSTAPLYGATFSPDGKALFVARAKNANDPASVPSLLSKTTSFIIDPAKFDTVRFSRVPVPAKAPLFLPAALQGPGVPLLVTNTEMLRLAFGGVLRTDTTRGDGSLILPLRFDSVRMPALTSPDHTLVSWTDTTSGAVTVYRLSNDTLEKVTTITGIIPGRYVLGNTGLYELRQGVEGVEVWEHIFDANGTVTKVHTFPKQITIVGMAF